MARLQVGVGTRERYGPSRFEGVCADCGHAIFWRDAAMNGLPSHICTECFVARAERGAFEGFEAHTTFPDGVIRRLF